MTPHKRIWQSTTLAVALLTTAPPAHAYLDPSTASMVISAIVGLFATATLAIKTYWYKLKSLFRKGQAEDSDAVAPSSSDTNISPDS